MNLESDAWTPRRAETVLREVLGKIGIDAGDFRLLRLGENMSFAVDSAALVVRLSRPYATEAAIENEIGCARYLEEQGYPAGRLFGEVRQPLESRLGWVTLWRQQAGREGKDEDQSHLGHLLGLLHRLPPSSSMRSWAPLSKVDERMRQISLQGRVPEGDIRFLWGLKSRLESDATPLSRVCVNTMCHGDAHTGNLLIDDDSETAILVDWEDCSLGPPAWDIGEALIAHKRFGMSDALLDQFFEAYGDGPRDLELEELSVRMRELTTVSWLLQNAEDPTVLAEGRRRIETLREPGDTRVWSAF